MLPQGELQLKNQNNQNNHKIKVLRLLQWTVTECPMLVSSEQSEQAQSEQGQYVAFVTWLSEHFRIEKLGSTGHAARMHASGPAQYTII